MLETWVGGFQFYLCVCVSAPTIDRVELTN